MASTAKVRVQVDLSPKKHERLSEVAESKETSNSGVVRNALDLYFWIDRELRAGNKLALIRPDGSVRMLELFPTL